MSSLYLQKTHACTLAPTHQPNTGLSYRRGIPAPRPFPSQSLWYEPDRGWESHLGLNRDTLPKSLYWHSSVVSEQSRTDVLAPVPHPPTPSIPISLGIRLHTHALYMCVASLIPERVWTQLCACVCFFLCMSMHLCVWACERVERVKSVSRSKWSHSLIVNATICPAVNKKNTSISPVWKWCYKMKWGALTRDGSLESVMLLRDNWSWAQAGS